MDILGSFPWAIGGCEYLHMDINKFAKWSEAVGVTKINKHSDIKFLWGTISRLGGLKYGDYNNGTQFTSGLFSEYCDDMGIKLCFASPHHPQRNRKDEWAIVEILWVLKTSKYDCLKKHGTKWTEDLELVLQTN